MSGRSSSSFAPTARPRRTFARPSTCCPAATMSALSSMPRPSPIPVEISADTKDIVMKTELVVRLAARLGAPALLACLAAVAPAQPAPPPASGVDFAAPPADAAAPPARAARQQRARVQPYLEVAQVISADLSGGDTLTYTSLSA